MRYLLLFYATVIFVLAQESFGTIKIYKESSNIDILSKSYIFIDNTGSLSLDKIVKSKFKKNDKPVLWLGIKPHTSCWIKFRLKNETSSKITKILEYQNPKTEEIIFYDGKNKTLEGMFHKSKDRFSINPIFKIELKPHEERLFFIKAHSKISTLIVKLKLWNEFDFIQKDYKNKICLFIFFTIIITLLVYNLILYLFTKDIIYLFYVLYLFSIVIVQSIHLGFAQLYLLNDESTQIIIKGSLIYISFLIISSILFVMNFLHTSKYKRLHNLLKFYLYLTPLIAVLSYDNLVFNLKILIIYFPLGFLMIYTGVYAHKNGVKEAKIYLAGWSLVIITLLFSVLKTLGIYDIRENFHYINEFAFVIEAFVFSIALAYRINILSEYKRTIDKKLIKLQEEEKEKLKRVVNKQTKELQESLEEKDILYKELNHRVKNNLQMILSLMKLQINSSKSKETIEDLTVTKDRINSITKLYEIIYTTNNSGFNAKKYFEYITKNITDNYNKKIDIEYSITHNVEINQLVYCGLILNELVTNSIKYAFSEKEKNPSIKIRLFKENGIIYFIVEDNGKGFSNETNSLGLTIVKTLAKKQLHGEIDFISNNGLKVVIKWKNSAT